MREKLNKIKRIIKKTLWAKNFLIAFSFLGIFYNLFFMNSFSDLYFLFFFLVYWGAAHQLKQGGKISISLAIIFLFLIPFLIAFESNLFVHKVSGWAFAFLCVGVLEHLLVLRRQNDSLD